MRHPCPPSAHTTNFHQLNFPPFPLHRRCFCPRFRQHHFSPCPLTQTRAQVHSLTLSEPHVKQRHLVLDSLVQSLPKKAKHRLQRQLALSANQKEAHLKKLAAPSSQKRHRIYYRSRYSHLKKLRPTTRSSLLCYASRPLSILKTLRPRRRYQCPRPDQIWGWASHRSVLEM